VGLSTEAAIRGSGKTNTGIALAQAMKAALGQAGLKMSDVVFFAHDVSGERFYFNELAFAIARSRPKKIQRWTPTVAVGEIGAAVGPLSVGYLAFMLGAGGAPGPITMFVTASDGPSRGAVIVSESPRKRREGR